MSADDIRALLLDPRLVGRQLLHGCEQSLVVGVFARADLKDDRVVIALDDAVNVLLPAKGLPGCVALRPGACTVPLQATSPRQSPPPSIDGGVRLQWRERSDEHSLVIDGATSTLAVATSGEPWPLALYVEAGDASLVVPLDVASAPIGLSVPFRLTRVAFAQADVVFDVVDGRWGVRASGGSLFVEGRPRALGERIELQPGFKIAFGRHRGRIGIALDAIARWNRARHLGKMTLRAFHWRGVVLAREGDHAEIAAVDVSGW